MYMCKCAYTCGCAYVCMVACVCVCMCAVCVCVCVCIQYACAYICMSECENVHSMYYEQALIYDHRLFHIYGKASIAQLPLHSHFQFNTSLVTQHMNYYGPQNVLADHLL